MWAIWRHIDLVIKIMKTNGCVGAQRTISHRFILSLQVAVILFRQYLNESLKLQARLSVQNTHCHSSCLLHFHGRVNHNNLKSLGLQKGV